MELILATLQQLHSLPMVSLQQELKSRNLPHTGNKSVISMMPSTKPPDLYIPATQLTLTPTLLLMELTLSCRSYSSSPSSKSQLYYCRHFHTQLLTQDQHLHQLRFLSPHHPIINFLVQWKISFLKCHFMGHQSNRQQPLSALQSLKHTRKYLFKQHINIPFLPQFLPTCAPKFWMVST